MGWQDREYYRDDRPPSNPAMWLLSGSISLGTWFGIRVRLHASMIILLILALLFPGSMGGVQNTLTFAAILFGIVLLHEFGHCFASRAVGGNPDEILMYPLGGLAMAGAPHRPWANFVTVAGGPLVNVLICLVTGGALMLMRESSAIPWNPLRNGLMSFIPANDTAYYLWWIFTVSYALLLFNLWPIFPLDGGQLLQSLLWVKFGYYRSMIFACITGMIGAVAMAAVGLASRELLLLFIAISGFMTCYQRYHITRAAGPYESYDDLSFDVRPRRRKLTRWSIWRAKKLVREEHNEQIKIDAILAKVSAHGMQSLTWWEKRTLRKATARQRERDAELARHERIR